MPRLLLAAEFTKLEPLALYHLATIAREEGWEYKVLLPKPPEFHELLGAVETFKPDAVGFSLYTGNHNKVFSLLEKVKEIDPGIITILGGAHPTYFPTDCLESADVVVVGDGLDALRKILSNGARGITYSSKQETMSVASRDRFYEENPDFRDNPIKNAIGGVGCPYNCTYCYNSNTVDMVPGLTSTQVADIKHSLGGAKRFFPGVHRPVDDVVREAQMLKELAPKTDFIFFEDDIFGLDLPWLREFTQKYDGIYPFHVNMRFEMINPEISSGRERLDLLEEAGCTGVSMGIESGNRILRKEVCGRMTPDELVVDVIEHLAEKQFNMRAYHILGVPSGATSVPTNINLEADLETLETAVDLRARTGLPTIAWASTLTPYPGTLIAEYCVKHGFCEDNPDILGDETYRILSVLKFRSKWAPPGEPYSLLSDNEQVEYKTKLQLLMNYFVLLASMEDGHKIGRQVIEDRLQPEEFLDQFGDRIGIPGMGPVIERFLADESPEIDTARDGVHARTPSRLSAMTRSHIYETILFHPSGARV